MTSVIKTSDAEMTQALGRLIADVVQPDDVLLLTGDLGAGKTCLTKGLAEGLGVKDPVTSPTFNILLVYPGRSTLFHFDLYRLDRSSQLTDVDYWETLESGGVSVVEWGDRFPDAMPQDGLSIQIHITGDSDREIELLPIGPRGERLAAEIMEQCSRSSEIVIGERT